MFTLSKKNPFKKIFNSSSSSEDTNLEHLLHRQNDHNVSKTSKTQHPNTLPPSFFPFENSDNFKYFEHNDDVCLVLNDKNFEQWPLHLFQFGADLKKSLHEVKYNFQETVKKQWERPRKEFSLQLSRFNPLIIQNSTNKRKYFDLCFNEINFNDPVKTIGEHNIIDAESRYLRFTKYQKNQNKEYWLTNNRKLNENIPALANDESTSTLCFFINAIFSESYIPAHNTKDDTLFKSVKLNYIIEGFENRFTFTGFVSFKLRNPQNPKEIKGRTLGYFKLTFTGSPNTDILPPPTFEFKIFAKKQALQHIKQKINIIKKSDESTTNYSAIVRANYTKHYLPVYKLVTKMIALNLDHKIYSQFLPITFINFGKFYITRNTRKEYSDSDRLNCARLISHSYQLKENEAISIAQYACLNYHYHAANLLNIIAQFNSFISYKKCDCRPVLIKTQLIPAIHRYFTKFSLQNLPDNTQTTYKTIFLQTTAKLHLDLFQEYIIFLGFKKSAFDSDYCGLDGLNQNSNPN